MGVAGLWDVLRPAGQRRSLTHLAVVDGFENNAHHRGLRIGIDASIWFFHAQGGREGENPEIRTLFFRCCRLMNAPFLPLFVFDGSERPKWKRGKRISGRDHWMVTGMKNLVNAFGYEWRQAPGEAEAELAYLNRLGVIDAILSDDVDTLLFGATMIIRNPSATLSGNRSHVPKDPTVKDDGNHSFVYTASSILSHPDIQLTHGGLILIGLLSGGDYDGAGVIGCGITIAHGLAKAGLGDTLTEAASALSREDLEDFLRDWREELRKELKTNSKGRLNKKSPTLANKIPDTFPSVDVLLNYVKPIVSATTKNREYLKSLVEPSLIRWSKEPDLGKIAAICEMYFEWGVKESIVKRFRTNCWGGVASRVLRRATLDKVGVTKTVDVWFDSRTNKDDSEEDGQLVVKIHSTRRHAVTDNILEYRLELDPSRLVAITEAGVIGYRPNNDLPVLLDSDCEQDEVDDEDDDGRRGKKMSKKPPHPHDHLRVWIPACMVKLADPGLVEKFEEGLRLKEERAAKRAPRSPSKPKSPAKPKTKTQATKAKSSTARFADSLAALLREEEEEEGEVNDSIVATKAGKAKSKIPAAFSRSGPSTQPLTSAEKYAAAIAAATDAENESDVSDDSLPDFVRPLHSRSRKKPTQRQGQISDVFKSSKNKRTYGASTKTNAPLEPTLKLDNYWPRADMPAIEVSDSSDGGAPSAVTARGKPKPNFLLQGAAGPSSSQPALSVDGADYTKAGPSRPQPWSMPWVTEEDEGRENEKDMLNHKTTLTGRTATVSSTSSVPSGLDTTESSPPHATSSRSSFEVGSSRSDAREKGSQAGHSSLPVEPVCEEMRQEHFPDSHFRVPSSSSLKDKGKGKVRKKVSAFSSDSDLDLTYPQIDKSSRKHLEHRSPRTRHANKTPQNKGFNMSAGRAPSPSPVKTSTKALLEQDCRSVISLSSDSGDDKVHPRPRIQLMPEPKAQRIRPLDVAKARALGRPVLAPPAKPMRRAPAAQCDVIDLT